MHCSIQSASPEPGLAFGIVEKVHQKASAVVNAVL